MKKLIAEVPKPEQLLDTQLSDSNTFHLPQMELSLEDNVLFHLIF